jgi:hypothetical protein
MMGSKEGDPSRGVSPDEIAARPSTEADLAEIVDDVTSLLLRKQQQTSLPLVGVFRAMMSGQNRDQQRAQFGDGPTRTARSIIVQVIRHYAQETGNYRLLQLLRQFEDFRPNKPTSKARGKVPQPYLSDKERDYRSIAQVIARFDHRVGTAQLGSLRRRWLEYPPRDPASGHRNRLEEVLAAMVRDGQLQATPTRQGALVYGRGPNFDQVLPAPAV